VKATTTLAALSAAAKWLQVLYERGSQLAALEGKAIGALHQAVNQTRNYLQVEESGDRNLKREAELSVFWMDAYHALSDLDAELGERCLVKSGYWGDPSKWTPMQIEQADITLEAMAEDAEALLSNPRYRT